MVQIALIVSSRTCYVLEKILLKDKHCIMQNRWIYEMLDLGKKWTWVQIFENRGALMGCSNAHPHCQIWSSSFLPNEIKIKDGYLKDFYTRNKKPLLIDYMQKEILKKVGNY